MLCSLVLPRTDILGVAQTQHPTALLWPGKMQNRWSAWPREILIFDIQEQTVISPWIRTNNAPEVNRADCSCQSRLLYTVTKFWHLKNSGSSGTSKRFIIGKNTLGGKLTKTSVPNIKNWHKKPEKVKNRQKKGKKPTLRNAWVIIRKWYFVAWSQALCHRCHINNY